MTKRHHRAAAAAFLIAAAGCAEAPPPTVQELVQPRPVFILGFDGLEPGTQIKVKWRGKPVFIRHRTGEEISSARALDVSTLPDQEARNPNLTGDIPATDDNRIVPGHEQYLVMIGVCTHLGCVPLGEGAGEFGGWFCPCHGSHYDTAGRIRKGPAPENLHIPKLSLSDNLILKLG